LEIEFAVKMGPGHRGPTDGGFSQAMDTNVHDRLF
jgi:hypothetical protein